MTCSPNFIPDPTLYDDQSGRAERVCRFVRRLKLFEGKFSGQNFTLHPFQEAMLRRIYGPTAEDGSRQVKTAAIFIPRGNAKTTLSAALSLVHFMGPESEPGAQVIACGSDRSTATIAFNSAWQMIRQDQTLLSRVRPIESQKTLIHEKTASTLKAISSEAYSKQGLSVSFAIMDEIVQWQVAEARKLYSAIRDSQIKRESPLTVIITTAGDGQGTLGHDLYDYSLRVASGEIIDPSWAPIIFRASEKDDWKDEETWRKANPAIDAGFINLGELREKAKRAVFMPRDLAGFKQYHLGLWADGASEPWVSPEIYDAAEPRTDFEELEGSPAFIGIDMAAVTDMAAVAICWPDGAGGFDIDVTGFFPSENLAGRGERDAADYQRWHREGSLKLTSGNIIDQNAIFEHVIELAERFSVKEVVLDRWGSIGFMERLTSAGIVCATFGQGFASMSQPVKEMERAILSKQLRHGGNPVLKSAIANVALEVDSAGNGKFTKSKARGRIDAAVSAAMAIGRASSGNSSGTNPYEERGFLFL